jgi:hypothetical protein
MASAAWFNPEKKKKNMKLKKMVSSALGPQFVKYTTTATTAYDNNAMAD